MSSFTNQQFAGYTRAPGQTRVGILKTPIKRTSRYRSPSPTKRTTTTKRTTRRKSKERSPRSQLIKRISKGFRRMSPTKFRNKYIRDIGELAVALSPFIIGALSVALYLRENKPEEGV